MDLEALIAGIVRFRSGRPGAELHMLSVLSSTNLFVVVDEQPPSGLNNPNPVSIRIGSSEGRSSAYLFTSETLLSSWCTKQGWGASSACISGGDLSLSLPRGAWVEIDPGTPHHVILSPKQLERLGQPFDKGATGAVADDAGFTRWADKGDVEQKQSTPAELFPEGRSEAAPASDAGASPGSQQPGKKRPFMRSNPTTIFAAPTLEKKKTDLESRPRTYTASNLKKIIRSTKPDGSE